MSDGQTRALRVLLVDTSPRDRAGSMRRYGDLVIAAVAGAATAGDVELRRLELAPPAQLSAHLAPRLEPWGRRAWGRLWSLAHRPPAADVVHVLDASSGLAAGRRLGAPLVATVHDLIPLLQMRGRLEGGRKPGAVARWVIGRTLADLAQARRVVADSRRTAEDVVELAPLESSRVTTIPLPVPPAFLDGPFTHRSPEAPLILHVGNGGFYKNPLAVLRIVGRVHRRIPLRLALVGSALSPEMEGLAGRLGLRARIEVHPLMTDAELAALYRRASLLLMPSLYEGFGWPALEAMACGCPVVCSTAGSLPEVVGDAALTAPAGDEEGLAEHVTAILGDPGLAQRLSERGRTHARGFRLEEMGRRLVDVYRAAAEREEGALA